MFFIEIVLSDVVLSREGPLPEREAKRAAFGLSAFRRDGAHVRVVEVGQ